MVWTNFFFGGTGKIGDNTVQIQKDLLGVNLEILASFLGSVANTLVGQFVSMAEGAVVID